MVSRSGCAVILITHDLLDVFTLADRVLVLESGKIAEIGPVADVLAAPRSHFGARIAGVNLVNGTIGPDGSLHTRSGVHWHGTPAPEVGEALSEGHDAVAVFAPDCGGRLPGRAARQPTQHRRGDRGGAGYPRIRGAGARPEQPDGAPGLAAEITVDAAAELRLSTRRAGVVQRQSSRSGAVPGAAPMSCSDTIRKTTPHPQHGILASQP